MKLLNKFPIFLVFISLTLFISCEQQYDIEKLKVDVNSINDQITKAMLENDHESSLKFYTEDAISLPSYQPMIKGLEAIKAQSEKQKEMPMDMRTFSLTTTDVWVSGKFIVEIGKYDLTMGMPEAPEGEIADQGKYLTLFEIQQNGSLLIKADTWNTDFNPWEAMMEHKEGDGK
jgi:ketosteroid isomerase-like protein